MAAEKNFENRVKVWLKNLGCYPLGTAVDKMTAPPIGYYEKRWGGGYSKKGLPDMHIVINGFNLDVELKAPNGKPSKLQKHNVAQINFSGSIAMILYPDGFDQFKSIVRELIKCNGHIPVLNALRNANANSSCDMLIRSK